MNEMYTIELFLLNERPALPDTTMKRNHAWERSIVRILNAVRMGTQLLIECFTQPMVKLIPGCNLIR